MNQTMTKIKHFKIACTKCIYLKHISKCPSLFFINIFSSRVGLCLGRLANAPTNPLAWFMIFPVEKTWCYLLPNNLKKFQREFQASIKCLSLVRQSTAKIIYLLKHFVHNDSTLRAMFTFTVLITGTTQKLQTKKKNKWNTKKTHIPHPMMDYLSAFSLSYFSLLLQVQC